MPRPGELLRPSAPHDDVDAEMAAALRGVPARRAPLDDAVDDDLDGTAEEEARHPALRFRPGFAGALFLLTWAVALGAWCAPFLPVGRGRAWERLETTLGSTDPGSLPSWWTSSLYVVVAVTLVAAAAQANGSRRRIRAAAWMLGALGLAWLSFDQSVQVDANLRAVTADRLPSVVGTYPVLTALALFLVPVGLVLLVRSSPVQWLLLLLAPVLYGAGRVGIEADLVELPLSDHHTAVAAMTAQWLGVLLLAFAATAERRRTRSREL